MAWSRPGDAPPARAPGRGGGAGRSRPPGRDPLGRAPRAGGGLHALARRRGVVGPPDRARLLQGRREPVARPRLPGPRGRLVAPGAALRLTGRPSQASSWTNAAGFAPDAPAATSTMTRA